MGRVFRENFKSEECVCKIKNMDDVETVMNGNIFSLRNTNRNSFFTLCNFYEVIFSL